METTIQFLTPENRTLFLPCIMPALHPRMDDPTLFGYGVLVANQAAGALLCSYDDGVVNLLSIGVSPDYRRQGLATQLLQHLVGVCQEQGYDELNASYFLEDSQRTVLEGLLAGVGFSFLEGIFQQFRFTFQDLQGCRVEKRLQNNYAQRSPQVVSFGRLAPVQQQDLLELLGVSQADAARLSPTRSCVYLKNGQVTGAALLAESPDLLEIVQIYSVQGDEAASILALFSTLGEAYHTLPATTEIWFHAADDIAQIVVDKLLPDCPARMVQERVALLSVAAALPTPPATALL